MSLQNCRHKVVTKTSLQIDHSSSSSTSSPSHTLQLITTQNTKTMEEVWKDINLASLSDNPDVDLSAPSPLNRNNHNSHHNTSNFTLQDFFSRPYARDSSQPRVSSPNIMPATPPNVLNLNSAPSFDFPDSHDNITTHGSLHFHNQLNVSNVYSTTSNRPHMGMISGGARTSSNGNSIDRRQKRMIKNRESAARSRHRRQAYTVELEQASHRLKEENKVLKEKNKQLMMTKAVEIPKKRPFFRAHSL